MYIDEKLGVFGESYAKLNFEYLQEDLNKFQKIKSCYLVVHPLTSLSGRGLLSEIKYLSDLQKDILQYRENNGQIVWLLDTDYSKNKINKARFEAKIGKKFDKQDKLIKKMINAIEIQRDNLKNNFIFRNSDLILMTEPLDPSIIITSLFRRKRLENLLNNKNSVVIGGEKYFPKNGISMDTIGCVNNVLGASQINNIDFRIGPAFPGTYVKN